MQIDAIDVFHVGLPLRKPQRTQQGDLQRVETVLVRLRSNDLSGWGEVAPGNAPMASEEWAAGVFACIRDWLAPAVAGVWIDSGNALQGRLASFRGNRHAKAALDMAWWDLSARNQNVPLHKLVGGTSEAVDLGTSFDQMDTIDDLLDALHRAMDAGYARAELKLRPGWDIQMLNAVRQEFPVETLHADIEGSMRLDHMELLYRMDDFALAMVEQPFTPDDLVGHAMLQQALRTPISLDESIATPEHADMALDLQSCRYVNLKLGRVGGFTPAMAIHDAFHDNCLPCRAGMPLQSSIGVRAMLALASKANFNYPADGFVSDEILQRDLAPPPTIQRQPETGILQAVLWQEAGLGVDPDLSTIDELCLAKAVINPNE